MTTIPPAIVRALSGVKVVSWSGNDAAGEVEYLDGKTLHFRVWKQASHGLKEYAYAVQRSDVVGEQAWALTKRAAWLALERACKA